ncbi:ribosomal large subunit pseudouridine synthase D [Mesorhizobium australicum]|uniref:Pseudouridine synthase n=2 Tax=Mesorhizobium australicum TaxID=536018 RepID=A0A1X7PT75_9HYPH|nr:ribosomal large subunit pseudouridine synthase D [Mesorhizobium australicum]
MMNAPDSEAGSPRKAYHAGPDAAGQRLDQWLAGVAGPDLSRSRVQALIKAGAVTVSGATVGEPKHKLAGGEDVVIDMPAPAPAEPRGEDIALDILYEDDQLIVIDKPAGLVVHQGAGNWTGTLVNALIHHCGASLSGIGGVARPGIVHRLDKDTSGVMVAAKTDLAHRELSDAFADHGQEGDLERAYLAVVWGVPSRKSGMIDAHLGRSTKDRTRQAVVPETRPDARHAITHFEVLETFGAKRPDGPVASLVECRLETGRTHQIRVHMAHIGHPLVGDRDYGAGFRTKSNRLPDDVRQVVDAFPRQALHAGLLAFAHPVSGEVMEFEAPLPADMQALIAALRTL